MTTTLGLWSLLPPVLATILAFWTRRIQISLFAGVLSAIVLLNLANPWVTPFAAFDYMLKVAAETENLQLITFSLLIGALLKLMRDAGGFMAFSRAIERARGGYGKPTVFGLTWFIGVVMLLESWSNMLVAGTTLGPLYDRLKISRERLAYFIHTIGLNSVAILVINSWGAFYVVLLSAQGVQNPIGLVVQAIPFNFYGWASLVLVAIVMVTGLTLGPMRAAEARARAEREQDPAAEEAKVVAHEVAEHSVEGERGVKPRLVYMLVPILTLIGAMLVSMWITGKGEIARGDGTAAILHAVIAALIVLTALLLGYRAFAIGQIEDKAVKGMQEFFEITILIVLALALGQLCKDMGTGAYMAELTRQALPAFLVPALVFLIGAVMSFATGTSYGTLSLLVPIVMPMAAATGLPAPLLFGATLSGAVFGDNTALVNDTAIVASMAAETTVVDHVKTQLPYALIAAAVATVGFVVAGLLA